MTQVVSILKNLLDQIQGEHKNVKDVIKNIIATMTHNKYK